MDESSPAWASPPPADDMDVWAAAQRRLLLSWFRRLGLGHHDAEDCAQDALLRVHRSLPRYEPRAPFVAFLRRVARSVHADWCRRDGRRRAAIAPQSGVVIDPREMPARPGVHPATLIDLHAALSRLPRKLADVVELTARRGMSYRDAAALLHIPVGTVKSRMYLAVRRLRQELRDAR